MKVYWSKHAKKRFFERAVRYDLTEDEVELEVIGQKIKINEGFDEEYGTEKFKTIFKTRGIFLTVEKAEAEKHIRIITLWESSQEEIEKWQKAK